MMMVQNVQWLFRLIIIICMRLRHFCYQNIAISFSLSPRLLIIIRFPFMSSAFFSWKNMFIFLSIVQIRISFMASNIFTLPPHSRAQAHMHSYVHTHRCTNKRALARYNKLWPPVQWHMHTIHSLSLIHTPKLVYYDMWPPECAFIRKTINVKISCACTKIKHKKIGRCFWPHRKIISMR